MDLSTGMSYLQNWIQHKKAVEKNLTFSTQGLFPNFKKKNLDLSQEYDKYYLPAVFQIELCKNIPTILCPRLGAE